jgi:hypothetical protein
MRRTWPVEDLSGHGVLRVVGDVVIRHDYNVVRVVPATDQNLIRMKHIGLVPAGVVTNSSAAHECVVKPHALLAGDDILSSPADDAATSAQLNAGSHNQRVWGGLKLLINTLTCALVPVRTLLV